MRLLQEQRDFAAKVITGTHTILIALNCSEKSRKGLMGFAFKREILGKPQANGDKWLRSQKVFKSLIKDFDAIKSTRFSTLEHPVQSFLWGDYSALPHTR